MIIKNFKNRAVSFIVIFAVVISCAAVSSCTQQGKTAMTLTYNDNKSTISSNIYSYYLSYTKTMLLMTMYSQMGYTSENISSMVDIPEYWTTLYDETMTYGDLAKLQAEETIKRFLAIDAYCKENNLKLAKEDLNNIDVAIKEILKLDKYGNSRAALNSVLLRFNINDAIYKEIRKLEALTGVFGTDLFDPATGKNKITDDMINAIYQETCVRAKHIFIRLVPGTYDAENKPEQYPEEELAARKAKAQEIYDKIMAGEDFDSFLSESEDPNKDATPDGYTVSEATNFIPEFITAAFEMAVGEVRAVESSVGMHIIKKYELLPADQSVDIDTSDTWKNAVTSQIKSYLMNDVLKPYTDKVEITAEETSKFDIASSAVMFDCLELW